jgi:release factor glutamine methyltransferase
MWTVAELLAWTTERFARAGLGSPRSDAQHLLAHALGCSRMELYLRHDQVPSDAERDRFRELVRRRLRHEPVAYIEGIRGFHALDLELCVDRRVLIPRPETEHLVDWLLDELPPPGVTELHILDVGTGSGAIALALAHVRSDLRVLAVDRFEDALAVARANAETLGLEIELARTDLLEDVPVPPGGFYAVAANLPYVPTEALAGLDPDVRDFEPLVALDGGPDGLSLVRRLVDGAPAVLREAGGLYLEVGIGQADHVVEYMRDAGFSHVDARRDLAGISRAVRGFVRIGRDAST